MSSSRCCCSPFSRVLRIQHRRVCLARRVGSQAKRRFVTTSGQSLPSCDEPVRASCAWVLRCRLGLREPGLLELRDTVNGRALLSPVLAAAIRASSAIKGLCAVSSMPASSSAWVSGARPRQPGQGVAPGGPPCAPARSFCPADIRPWRGGLPRPATSSWPIWQFARGSSAFQVVVLWGCHCPYVGITGHFRHLFPQI